MRISVQMAEAIVNEWRASAPLIPCVVRHPNSREDDQSYPGYTVLFEAIFEPRRLDQARLEVWFTSSGHTAIGIETWSRASRRLGLRAWRKGFAIGHEPRDVSVEQLEQIHTRVSSGNFELICGSRFGVLFQISSADLGLPEIDTEHPRAFLQSHNLSFISW